MDSKLITVIVSTILGGGLLSAIYALLKLRPEAGQITVTAAQGAVIVQSSVIETLNKEMSHLREEVAQVEMQLVASTEAHKNCRDKMRDLETSIRFWQRDVDRYGRMTELSRRRSHLLANAFTSLEVVVDKLIDKMRDNNVPVPSELKGFEVRNALRIELDKLSEMEAQITYEKVSESTEETAPEEDETV
jgi:septal ring factor EnvC (AmiA/AmiB activator)